MSDPLDVARFALAPYDDRFYADPVAANLLRQERECADRRRWNRMFDVRRIHAPSTLEELLRALYRATSH